MNAINTLAGFTPTPPGLERQVLRRVPGALLLGLPSLRARFFTRSASGADFAVRPITIDIHAIALVGRHWTHVIAVTTAAFIVMVMKGPADITDAYPLDEAEAPDDGGRWRQS